MRTLLLLPLLALIVIPAYAQSDEAVEFKIGALVFLSEDFDDSGRLAAKEIAASDWNAVNGQTHHLNLTTYQLSLTDPMPGFLKALGIDDSKYEAQLEALLDDAIASYESHGFAGIDGHFEGQLYYPFVVDQDGFSVSHGENPALVGSNVIDLVRNSDKTVEEMISDMESNPSGITWWQYAFTNPTTGTDQVKRSLLKMHDGYIFGAGYYPNGPTYFAGPATSSASTILKEYADANDIIIVSPSSTSPGLAIPGDNVFRLAPDDANQAPFIAELIHTAGKDNIVIVQRDDAWGRGIVNAFTPAYEGDVSNIVILPVENPDYEAAARSLDDALGTALSSSNSDTVGVLLATFAPEMVRLLQAILDDPDLQHVRQVSWYGSDGITQKSVVVDAPQVAALATDLHFVSTIFEVEENEIIRGLLADLEEYDGLPSPSVYSYSAYDTVMLLADTYKETGGAFAEMKAALPDVARRSVGALGNYSLNEAGDLDHKDYGVYEIIQSGGEYIWISVGSELDPHDDHEFCPEGDFPFCYDPDSAPTGDACSISYSLGQLTFGPADSDGLSHDITQLITNTGYDALASITVSASDWTDDAAAYSIDATATEIMVQGVLDDWTPLSDDLKIYGELAPGSSFEMSMRVNLAGAGDLPTSLDLMQEIAYEISSADGDCSS